MPLAFSSSVPLLSMRISERGLTSGSTSIAVLIAEYTSRRSDSLSLMGTMEIVS